MARSFELLKTDYIEVMQIHNLVDWRTHLPLLEEMKADGKISVIGLTHYSPDALPEMAEIMRTGRVDSVQISYNVMEREVEDVILPLAGEMGIGIIVIAPSGCRAAFPQPHREAELGAIGGVRHPHLGAGPHGLAAG